MIIKEVNTPNSMPVMSTFFTTSSDVLKRFWFTEGRIVKLIRWATSRMKVVSLNPMLGKVIGERFINSK